MSKRYSVFLCALFALFLGGILTAGLIAPDRDFSQTENRYLAQFPQLSWETVRDGTFMTQFETYVNDQFVARDWWVSLKSWCERLSGKRENNGVYFAADDTLINRVVTSLNSVIRAANSLSFTVPDWVPGIGGRTFGFHMRSVTAPQIPYLAQGAVLPANKPFLAMVGDQKHGTNIEAPLSTIQAAVATVMEEQTAAILAGFETSVGVQKEILEAVLGITIGDEVIGSAVARYDRKMRIMRGGAL